MVHGCCVWHMPRVNFISRNVCPPKYPSHPRFNYPSNQWQTNSCHYMFQFWLRHYVETSFAKSREYISMKTSCENNIFQRKNLISLSSLRMWLIWRLCAHSKHYLRMTVAQDKLVSDKMKKYFAYFCIRDPFFTIICSFSSILNLDRAEPFPFFF